MKSAQTLLTMVSMMIIALWQTWHQEFELRSTQGKVLPNLGTKSSYSWRCTLPSVQHCTVRREPIRWCPLPYNIKDRHELFTNLRFVTVLCKNTWTRVHMARNTRVQHLILDLLSEIHHHFTLPAAAQATSTTFSHSFIGATISLGSKYCG